MFIVKVSKQVVLHPDRLEALIQAIAIRKIIDRVLMKRKCVKYIEEKVEYFGSFEDCASDGLRLIVWIEYRGKDIRRFLGELHYRTLQTWVEKEVRENNGYK